MSSAADFDWKYYMPSFIKSTYPCLGNLSCVLFWLKCKLKTHDSSLTFTGHIGFYENMNPGSPGTGSVGR